MKHDLVDLIGKGLEIEISGSKLWKGILVDAGQDILVIFHSEKNEFLYIPFLHVQRIRELNEIEIESFLEPPSEKPIELESVSFRKILMNAKGVFVQIFVTGNKAIHGYLTSIMNDYFVFHSPVYKTMYISMNHVKWLIPYPHNTTPYSLTNQNQYFTPQIATLSRSFDEQLKKFIGKLIILDGGHNKDKIGLLQDIRNNKIALITAESNTMYWNLTHIKTVQFP
ncbi:DUF2642 domain-containing protein [Pallidibacillus thermolactis]|jgi:hypothetical protein|uniref:DUF2642 domain-containing protein n=1 Tax=Pallidibacillus thermolactis TaxID=251051 RepID=UPI00156B51CF|nr:DUF2642 domain-containing protein [Pallidibacillus thermolactis]MCU9601459.1 DUF2642 domain-containing protein [Pallidibacillus thermolactis subsp. kokeshiiformis]MED1673783.1 DUF2642 domain-containing protein [Pallidibacillus thermolactis subsp. kokeshiiformis]